MNAGDKYNRLTVIQKVKGRKWLFLCDCGKYKEMLTYHVKSGASKSCGCLHKEQITNHGKCGTKEHVAWLNMKSRCKRPTARQTTYAERGIGYAKEWEHFEKFLYDMGEMPDTTQKWTLERIDNNLGYFKENCKWALPLEQAHNRCLPRTNTSGYAGVEVRIEKSGNLVVRARIRYNGNCEYRRFPVIAYDSLEDALNTAIKWRKEKELQYNLPESYCKPLTTQTVQ